MAFRGLSILAATLVAALSSPSLAGETKLGAPNLDGDVLQSAATAACDESALPGKPGGGQIKRYKLTFLGSFTEFDPKTCKPHGPGSWTVTDQDRCDGKVCGKVTTGVIRNRPLASGECPGKTYDFGAICYTWTKRWNGQVDDTLQTVYVPPRVAPVSRTFKVKVPVVYPDKEKTEFAGWRPDGYGKWQATLTKTSDPSFDWSLNGVRESDPGFADPAADTCWCEGSIYDQFYKISGGDWDVTESGLWRFDMVASDGTRYTNRMLFLRMEVDALIEVEHGSDQDDDPGRFRMLVTFDEQSDGKTVLTLRQMHPSREQRKGAIGFGAVEYGGQTMDKLARHVAKRRGQ